MASIITTRSTSDKALIDHLLTTLNRHPADLKIYLALAALYCWDQNNANSYILSTFLADINNYFIQCDAFPTTAIKYTDGTDLNFSNHSLFCNLCFLIAAMHYKYNGQNPTNQ